MKWLWMLVIVNLFLIDSPVFGTTYYVKATGNDSSDGTTIDKAWKTLDVINLKNFAAGDKILFEGGSVFTGVIYLDQADAGTPASPILISSYGSGKAIINSINNFGIYAYNTAGIKITNIIFKGSGPTVNQENGIKFFTDIQTSKLDYIFIDNVEVYGYAKSGIFISAKGYDYGYRNITITNSKVHDNGEAGIRTLGDSLNLTKVYAHLNVYVANNKVYNITGQSNLIWFHTGSGIALASVKGGTIEYNETYNNGINNQSPYGGPIGIWIYNSNSVKIQYNESHHNKAGFDRDGGGFDIDGGTTNSVIQYNYSHDNEGSGLMVAQFKGAQVLSNNTIRYNISQNDGRKNGYPALYLWSSGSSGGIQNLNIYNNTIYLTPAPTGNTKTILIDGPMSNISFRNNIIYTTSYVYSVVSTISSGISFNNNSFYNSGTFNVWWTGSTYGSLASWSAATGQETNGTYGDPKLTSPGTGGTISNASKLNTLSGYKLQSTSPLINKGVDLGATGVNMGVRDYYGNLIPQQAAYDLGAGETGGATNVFAEINSPSTGSTFIKGSSVILAAAAAAGSSTITKTEFYNGTTLLGTSTTWPYKYTWSNLPLGTFTLTTKSYNALGESGTSAPVTITVVQATATNYRNPENPQNTVSGLDYSYYEGTWSVLPDFNTLTPVKTGTNPTFDLTQKLKADYFGFRFTGYVYVPTDGSYTFYTNSNDGSKLYIGTTELVKNDGIHGATEKSGAILLKAGKHAITVNYFDNSGSEILSVSYAGPGIAKQVIPSTSLFRISGTSSCTASGNILRETWTGITGDDVVMLTSNSNYPNTPSSRSNITIFEGPTNGGDNYGARYRGYICAPESGNYIFWIASDNNSELYLSSSDSPANKRKIAFVEGYTDSREWLKYGSQKSLPVTLSKGGKYYIEVLHKEGTGGDNLAVGWQLPSGTLERPIPGTRLSPFNISTAKINDDPAVDEISRITIYPVPAKENLNILLPEGITDLVRIEILNTEGRIIQSENQFESNSTGEYSMNVSNLDNGIYLIRIIHSENYETRKLVIRK